MSDAFCCDLHPNGIAAGPDGNLWYADDGVPWIARLTPGIAGWLTETTNIGLQWTQPGDVSKPTSIALSPTGNLWFTDNGGTKAIGEVDGNGFGKPNQGITGEFSQGLQQSGGTPLGGIAPGPDGNMWFTDDGTTPEIGQITPGGEIQEFELPSDSDPVDIAAGPDGNLWFTDGGTNPAIGRISTDGSLLPEISLPSGSKPIGIAEGSDDHMWLTDDGSTPRIGRIGSDGTISWFTLPSGSSPNEIAAGPDGSLWFTDDGSTPAIGQIMLDGAIHEFSDELQPDNGSHPLWIAAGPDGNMWFTDPGAEAELGTIGTGSPPATTADPSVVGSHEEGSPQSCQGSGWSSWDGEQPRIDKYPFDGYRWFRNDVPIAGADSPYYTPVAGDVGQELQCVVTASYSVVPISAPAISQQVTVLHPTSGSGTTTTKPAPKLTLITCKRAEVTVTRRHKKAH